MTVVILFLQKDNLMAILSIDRILVQGSAANKDEAIQKAGELLVKSGCVKDTYIKGMLAREKTMSTYLGNGVAIPHGEFENKKDIIKTGLSVLQLPEGVVWEDDEKAYLIIGIAATSDEHVGVLSKLAEVIEDEAMTQELIRTKDPNLILSTLGE